MNTNDFKKKVFELTKDEFTVIGEFSGSKSKIKMLHNKCGHTFEMLPYNFIYGQRCPFCNSNFNKINLDKAKTAFKRKGLLLLEKEYINSKTKMKCKCLKCGNIDKISYARVVYDDCGCAVCAKNKKLNFSDVKDKIEKSGEYLVLSNKTEYKNVHSVLEIKHKKCGYIYHNQYNNFRNGQRCPLCESKNSSRGMSKAVRNIIKYLIDNNIQYKTEYKFDDFKINKRLARYDLFFLDRNLLVEYYGKQHYKYNKSGFFNKEAFKKIQESDTKKQKYAKDHNINLEIISYTDDELLRIKEIIKQYKKI